MVAQEMEEKTVAVVILNWNGKDHLAQFLSSVVASTYPALEVIVGDNGSSDDSVAFVRAHYPQIRIIQNEENYGYAGGYNRVLQQVEADYYVLLNSDVEVTPDWIEPIINYLEQHPQMAAAQPKIRSFHERDRFEYAGAAGGYLDHAGFPFCRGRLFDQTEVDHGQYDDYREVFWASGAALFIKSTAWKQSGGFDPDFFAHMEEIDLCWRLKRLGYSIGYCPDAVVFHVGGGTLEASNPRKTYLNFRNNLYMLQKNLPFWRAVWIISLRMWYDFFALLYFAYQGKWTDAKEISHSHRSFFADFLRTSKKRKTIASAKTLNKSGYYRRSVVWDFYIRKKRSFNQLNTNKMY